MPDTGIRTTLVAMLEDALCQTRENAPRRSQRWRTRHARRWQTHRTSRNAGGRAMPDAGKRTTLVATLEDASCQTLADAPRRRTTSVATLEDAPCQTLADAPRWSQRWRTRHARREKTHHFGRNAGGRAMPDAGRRTELVATRKGRTMPDAGRRTTSVATLEDAPCQTLADAPRWSQRYRTCHARRGQSRHVGRNAGGRAMPDTGRRTTLVAMLEDAPCQTRGNAPRRSQRWRTRHARRRETHHTGRNAGGRAMPDTRRRTTLVATLEDAPCQTLADAPRWSQRWRTRHARRGKTHHVGRNAEGRAIPDAHLLRELMVSVFSE